MDAGLEDPWSALQISLLVSLEYDKRILHLIVEKESLFILNNYEIFE